MRGQLAHHAAGRGPREVHHQAALGPVKVRMATKQRPGLIEVSSQLSLLPGLTFRDPLLAEPVFTLGYPRVPLSREQALVMQLTSNMDMKCTVPSGIRAAR